jgi:hypothetical protein
VESAHLDLIASKEGGCNDKKYKLMQIIYPNPTEILTFGNVEQSHCIKLLEYWVLLGEVAFICNRNAVNVTGKNEIHKLKNKMTYSITVV